MTEKPVKDLIRQELPEILRTDPAIRELVLQLASEQSADKQETDSRFIRLLEELRREREEQGRRWHENQQALNRFIDEQVQKWAEQDRKWHENQQTINRMLDSIEALARQHDSTIGALGARWGLSAEQAFREGLRAILQKSFGVEVVNVVEYDDAGEVFGRPDQVELDIVVKDGLLIVCEIKSSMSRADMYIFERKARFYEQRHQRKAARLVVISPMVERRARELAERLGIEVYGYAEDVAVVR
jgi:hypothetical protein